MTKLNYRFYYQSGTMERPSCGSARGFDEQWQAEQYLDEEREHALAAARSSDRTQVARIVDNDAPYRPRTVYAEYVHGNKPEELRLDFGDYTAVVKVEPIDGTPAIVGGVYDDVYHDTNEPLSDAILDALGEKYAAEVEAYYDSLRFPARAKFAQERSSFEGHEDRPKLSSLVARKERA